ncbi:MAG TPA: paraquat-inducible protein A [Desulfobulbus sp.]|nr:paraquat-inducible protein A [Desulfobulbus sp.]
MPIEKNSPPVPALCPDCDLLLTSIDPPPGHTVRCPRCGRRLHKWKVHSIEKTLAISLTGLLLYIPANFMPLLTFDILGLNSSSSLFDSTLTMFQQGQDAVGIMVILSGFIFPLLILSLLLAVSSGLYFNRPTSWMSRLLRWYHHLAEWAMTDVYLIGVFVTIIKMSHMAEIEFNTGFFCFVGVVLATIAAQSTMDHHLFWSRLESTKTPPLPVDSSAETGAEAGLCLCPTCEKTLPLSPGREQNCPRCGQHLHLRKKDSLSRTWALILTAIILTLPANLLPIMEVEYFGVPDRSTIMDGIIYFFQEGSYGIGAIILTASILVPLFKIVGMILILLTIHFHWPGWLRHKALMFRFIEFIGRWSMLDIFVIALLCALVRFGFLSTINVAPAAFYFTGVVLCTMFAAINFDPRLLWDAGNSSPPKDVPDATTCS